MGFCSSMFQTCLQFKNISEFANGASFRWPGVSNNLAGETITQSCKANGAIKGVYPYSFSKHGRIFSVMEPVRVIPEECSQGVTDVFLAIIQIPECCYGSTVALRQL